MPKVATSKERFNSNLLYITCSEFADTFALILEFEQTGGLADEAYKIKFVCFDSLHLINNLSVIKGRVFLG